MEPIGKLTDLAIRSILRAKRIEVESHIDGTVAGLSLRVSPGGTASWSLMLRVVGEGGINKHGKRLLGKKHRIPVGNYPGTSIKAARAIATTMLENAANGINPKDALKQAATADGPTVQQLADDFLENHVRSRELDSVAKYESAFKTHIKPKIGERLAELVTREEARAVMESARVKRRRPKGQRGGMLGGIEAARTTMGVMHHMYAWGMVEKKLKRIDNPCELITKNLPRKKKGEVVLTLPEAKIVYEAAVDCGFPFGTQVQLELLTSLRLANWASAEEPWIDLKEALSVIPADNYKSDHVHVMPLVRPAVEILKSIPKPTTGPYILSSTGGSTPIQGISKFFRTRLRNQIIANTGAPLAKRLTSQTLRRTVATGIAEILGYEGEKLVKRVLGHSEGTVTAIYNRYGYVKEMRAALEKWANDLLAPSEKQQEEREAPLRSAA